MAWDRYAYVRNSPAMYTDPSGHRPCDQEVGGECISESGWYVPQYTIVNGRNLSHEIGRKTGISGADFYDWYKKLYFSPQSSWWWQMFGMDEDGFTVFDAMAVIMIPKAEYHWSEVTLPEAAMRAASRWNKGQPLTTAQYINWFAAYSRSAGGYVLKGVAPDDPFLHYEAGFDSGSVQSLTNLSHSFLDHPPEWDEGCVAESPCGWANNSVPMYPESVVIFLSGHKNAFFYYGVEPNAWFIPSGCVMSNWLDPNHRDLTVTCPNIIP